MTASASPAATNAPTQRQQEQRRPSDALIVHPLSLYGGGGVSADATGLSPSRWNDFYEFQRQELQRFLAQQQQALAAHALQAQEAAQAQHESRSLLDYTCEENIKSILGFLDAASLCSARRVCRYWNELGNSDAYWLNLCKAEWSIAPEQLHKRPTSYLELYKHANRSLKLLLRDYFQEQCLMSVQQSFRIPRDAAMVIAQRMSVA
ncbi:TPA: hypothetical protein N0F65_009707 [Lagenidium giganteum]|uniref:F-box domain-containing protein n=1 Tax=Lagenidium giganteum TaxID=4803 RepID=A0AAV2YGK1_9STRA|nr:TPA: hypothetical protein N0F65_009707 [Lagenidium giganteum]